MYWYTMKNGEHREVPDWIVLQDKTAKEYFDNPAIKEWGHTEDKKEGEPNVLGNGKSN